MSIKEISDVVFLFKEASRADFENGNPKPEELNDYELGWRFNREKANLLVNFYAMDYTNQLALGI